MNPKLSADEKRVADRWGVSLLIINVAGAAGYVLAASHGWVDPPVPVAGEPLIWAFYVFPIWAVFLLVNVTWGSFVLRPRHLRRGFWWLMTVPVWFVAMAIDFAHH